MSASDTPTPDWRMHLIRMAKCEDLHAIPALSQRAMFHIETLEHDLTALRERLAVVGAALETLLAKCPNCGGTGMVETGRIQFGYPSDSPCGLCANERKVFDAALKGVKK